MLKEEGDGYLVLQQVMATGIKRPEYGKIWLHLELRGRLWANEPHGMAGLIGTVSQCRKRERQEHRHRDGHGTS